jgi:hypothetical protein
MARKKVSVKKFMVSVNEMQSIALDNLMQEDMQDNVSQYIGFLIAEVSKQRESGRSKRSVGRPKNEKEEEVYYPAPYNKDAPPYTHDDLEAYYTARKEKVPAGLIPLTKEELKKWDM